MKKYLRWLSIAFISIFSFITARSQEGHWDTLVTKNKVNGHSECGMAANGGKLYLIGGEGVSSMEVFDPVTLSWTKKTEAPVAMNHFEAVSYKNKIYILEAFTSGGFPNQLSLTVVWIYDTEKNSWTSGAGLSAGRTRAAAGAAEYGGMLYLVAGIQHGHSSGTTNMFDVYDPQTNRWATLPDAPHIRDHCEAAVVGDKLYVAGGRNTSYRDPNNTITFFSQTVLDVDCYDFKTGKWSTLAARLPLGSGGGSMVNLKGKLYYMGGERATDTEPNAPRKNTYFLDPSGQDSWKETDSLKFGRNGMCAAVIDDKIYAFGGAGGGPGGRPPGGPNPNGLPGNPPPSVAGGPQGHSSPSPIEVFTLNK